MATRYLVLSTFPSRPTFLIESSGASVFSYCIYAPPKLIESISIKQGLICHIQFQFYLVSLDISLFQITLNRKQIKFIPVWTLL
jgi:hypothetical protein